MINDINLLIEICKFEPNSLYIIDKKISESDRALLLKKLPRNLKTNFEFDLYLNDYLFINQLFELYKLKNENFMISTFQKKLNVSKEFFIKNCNIHLDDILNNIDTNTVDITYFMENIGKYGYFDYTISENNLIKLINTPYLSFIPIALNYHISKSLIPFVIPNLHRFNKYVALINIKEDTLPLLIASVKNMDLFNVFLNLLKNNKIKKENFECFKPYLLDTPNTIIKYKLYKQEYYQLVKYLFPIEYSKGIKAVTDILNNISSSKNETLLVQLLSEKFGISTPISIDDNLIF